MRALALPLAAVVVLTGCAGGDDPTPAPGELVAAAERGDTEAVRALLARGADVDGRDARGRTAVTAAAAGEHVETVRALLGAGADVDLQDDDRSNPLLLSGENGNVELLRAVLAAEPDLTRTNRFGGTALIPAADRGHVEVVRELLRTEIDVDHVNDLGWTALLEAVLLGDGGAAHREIVRLLLAAGADRTIADREGVTPLEHARRLGHGELAALLERP